MHSSETRGTTPRTLIKIILTLGLALVGVAALAAEQPQRNPIQSDKPDAACAMTQFGFDGRTVENGNVTDNWTLTCWRQPPQQAAVPAAKPVAAQPVATGMVHNNVRAPDAQF